MSNFQTSLKDKNTGEIAGSAHVVLELLISIKACHVGLIPSLPSSREQEPRKKKEHLNSPDLNKDLKHQ